ncbi:MAG TPA: nuclear transport factor 2 family protein [Myxococcota bacterium]
MTNDSRLSQWLDKLEIHELVMKLARGIDRCDAALIASVFWPDATDDHGIFTGSASEFVAWVIPVLRGMERTQHAIANVLVDVRGDRGFSESYFSAYHRVVEAGAERDMFAAGRYLDRCERRSGEWRIAHRQTVYDWTMNQPASDDAWRRAPMSSLIERGARGDADRSARDKRAYLGLG